MNPNNPNARVFLAEPVSKRYNIKGTHDFGHVIYLFHPDNVGNGPTKRLNAFDITGNVKLFTNKLVEHEFDSGQDFICITGHNMVTAALTAAAFQVSEEVTFLAFNSAEQNYFPIKGVIPYES